MIKCRGDEITEQGVWPGRTAFELRVTLACHEPRVVRQLDHLNQAIIRGNT